MSSELSSLQNRFLDYFTVDGRRCLLEAASIVPCPEGTVLFDEGDVSDCVYLVVDGGLDVVKSSGIDRSAVLASFGPGEYLGELGVLSQKPRTTGARASTESRLARIPVDAVRKVLENEPMETALNFLDRALSYIHETNDRYTAAVVDKGKMVLVGEMSGSIIHDLRNPIAMIDLAVYMLSEAHKDEASQKACSAIRRHARRMTEMLRDLQDFSEGTLELELKEADIEELLRDFAQSVIGLAGSGGVKLKISGEPGRARIDPRRLLRVLDALFSNAVTAFGGKGGTFSLEGVRVEGSVEIRACDDGPGIAPEVRDTLFEPFVSHGRRRGTGLGLSVARKIIEAHGGTIAAQDAPGGGARFIIRIPV